jgi:uncharacterized protein (TIGR04255 family)
MICDSLLSAATPCSSMPVRPPDLPEFDAPPVVEVLLSLQFSVIEGFRTVHAGLLWERKFRAEFPFTSDQPALSPQFETFGRKDPTSRIQIRASQVAPLPRLWFMKEPEHPTEVVQFQTDRFTHNWRRVDQPYPRYERIRDRFLDELLSVREFLREEKLDDVRPTQCEIAYVNLIPLTGSDWADYEEMMGLIRAPVRHRKKGSYLPPLEDLTLVARFVLQDTDGERRGRLIVNAQPTLGLAGEQVLRLELTARGAPKSPDVSEIQEFYELGREAIVRGFTALTTSKMHEVWKRRK